MVAEVTMAIAEGTMAEVITAGVTTTTM